MRALPRQARCAVALALPMLALLLLGFGLVRPWLELRAQQDERIERALTLERGLVAAAARADGLLAEEIALNRQLSTGFEALGGATEAQAGAELQRRMRALAQAHQAPVASLEALPARLQGPAEGALSGGVVRVRARLATDPIGLRNLLLDLEGSTLPLRIERLTIVAATPGAAQPLDVGLDAAALWRPQAGR